MEFYGEDEHKKKIIESERSVLASILYNFGEVEDFLNIDSVSVDYFYSPFSRKIFQAIKNTSSKDGKYDFLMIMESLKKICVDKAELEGCVSYINNLPKDIHYFAVSKYLQLLKIAKIERELGGLFKSISKTSLNIDNFHDVIEEWRFKFIEIISQENSINYVSVKEAVDHFKNLVANSKKLGNSNFFKTNYADIDRKIKALSGGQLVVLASRPGVGKTTFALNIIHKNFKNISREIGSVNSAAIGIFSLEMTNASLLAKLIAIDAKIELNKVQKLLDGEAITSLESQLIIRSQERMSKLNFLMCDEANITIGKMVSTIKAWCKDYNPKLVIIDYLQLINLFDDKRLDNLNQYQKIGLVSRRLKTLSMEMNICILALAQLNRKMEERKGSEKSPILSDLRESGSIEQDADVVMFLYEENKNNKREDGDSDNDVSEFSYSPEGEPIMLKIAKNRHGPVGKVEFRFDKSLGIYKAVI